MILAKNCLQNICKNIREVIQGEGEKLQSKNRQLLFSITKKDLRIETMRGSGKGGQNRNKRDTAVRITHPDSGAVGYSEDERSQLQNKKKAFERLAKSDKFQTWIKIKASEVMGVIKTQAEIEKEIDEWMNEKYLKIEYL